MLVLTRKASEQILIGDDIKITLVRVRGNSVRLGIEAPREVRVVRGELANRLSDDDSDSCCELVERETVFAHPQEKIGRHTKKPLENRMVETPLTENATAEAPRIYVGRFRPASVEGKSGRAPLAGFVSAT